MAGYFGATHAMAWSVTAVLAPLFAVRWQTPPSGSVRRC